MALWGKSQMHVDKGQDVMDAIIGSSWDTNLEKVNSEQEALLFEKRGISLGFLKRLGAAASYWHKRPRLILQTGECGVLLSDIPSGCEDINSEVWIQVRTIQTSDQDRVVSRTYRKVNFSQDILSNKVIASVGERVIIQPLDKYDKKCHGTVLAVKQNANETTGATRIVYTIERCHSEDEKLYSVCNFSLQGHSAAEDSLVETDTAIQLDVSFTTKDCCEEFIKPLTRKSRKSIVASLYDLEVSKKETFSASDVCGADVSKAFDQDSEDESGDENSVHPNQIAGTENFTSIEATTVFPFKHKPKRPNCLDQPPPPVMISLPPLPPPRSPSRLHFPYSSTSLQTSLHVPFSPPLQTLPFLDIRNAETFVSHSWQYSFFDVISSLELWFKTKRRNRLLLNQEVKDVTFESEGSQETEDDDTSLIRKSRTKRPTLIMRYASMHVDDYDDPNKCFVWLDICTVPQHIESQANLPEDYFFNQFKAGIKEINNFVLVMIPMLNPIPLSRAWCVWEIFCSLETNTNFETALTPQDQLDRDANSILPKIKSDVKNAHSWFEEDTQRILESCETNIKGGCETIDRMVSEAFALDQVHHIIDTHRRALKDYLERYRFAFLEATVCDNASDLKQAMNELKMLIKYRGVENGAAILNFGSINLSTAACKLIVKYLKELGKMYVAENEFLATHVTNDMKQITDDGDIGMSATSVAIRRASGVALQVEEETLAEAANQDVIYYEGFRLEDVRYEDLFRQVIVEGLYFRLADIASSDLCCIMSCFELIPGLQNFTFSSKEHKEKSSVFDTQATIALCSVLSRLPKNSVRIISINGTDMENSALTQLIRIAADVGVMHLHISNHKEPNNETVDIDALSYLVRESKRIISINLDGTNKKDLDYELCLVKLAQALNDNKESILLDLNFVRKSVKFTCKVYGKEDQVNEKLCKQEFDFNCALIQSVRRHTYRKHRILAENGCLESVSARARSSMTPFDDYPLRVCYDRLGDLEESVGQLEAALESRTKCLEMYKVENFRNRYPIQQKLTNLETMISGSDRPKHFRTFSKFKGDDSFSFRP